MPRPEPGPAGVRAVTPDYDDDFFEWTQHTAALLRAGRLCEADVVHLAEEVEDMGKRDRRELERRLQVLLVHLLKWVAQPARRGASWRRTILAQRVAIAHVLRDSPSLRARLEADLDRHYADALHLATVETQLPGVSFPRQRPWTASEMLLTEFFPD